jgi:hypothetical protein
MDSSSIVGTSTNHNNDNSTSKSLGQWLSGGDSFAEPFTPPGQDQEQLQHLHSNDALPEQSFGPDGQTNPLAPNNTTGKVQLPLREEEEAEQERSIHVVQSLRTRRFKNRIADLDYAMAPPGPLDLHGCQFLPPHIPVLKVPVIRIYGANEAGQKTCVHIHQVTYDLESLFSSFVLGGFDGRYCVVCPRC